LGFPYNVNLNATRQYKQSGSVPLKEIVAMGLYPGRLLCANGAIKTQQKPVSGLQLQHPQIAWDTNLRIIRTPDFPISNTHKVSKKTPRRSGAKGESHFFRLMMLAEETLRCRARWRYQKRRRPESRATQKYP